ncbi:MAG: SDR family oxidoreductase, partial [Candidatus Binatia bacterium]
MRLLITGVAGMLGHTLMQLASERHEAWGSYRSFPVSFVRGQTFAMDLTGEAEVKARVLDLRPDVIIHTAALTQVDECERDPFRAALVNVQATETLVGAARELGSKFVYISTDYVFDGRRGYYAEADTPNPVNVYGRTKLSGEERVHSCLPTSLVLRTSIFGFNIQPKKGVVEYLIEPLEKRQMVSRYSDQFSTPIYTRDLSTLILELLDRGSSGLFHIGGGERVSRCDFAVSVADVFSMHRDMICAVPFHHFEGQAQRPKDSSLSGKKVEREL